jgi:hypothetical protein
MALSSSFELRRLGTIETLLPRRQGEISNAGKQLRRQTGRRTGECHRPQVPCLRLGSARHPMWLHLQLLPLLLCQLLPPQQPRVSSLPLVPLLFCTCHYCGTCHYCCALAHPHSCCHNGLQVCPTIFVYKFEGSAHAPCAQWGFLVVEKNRQVLLGYIFEKTFISSQTYAEQSNLCCTEKCPSTAPGQ